MEDFLGIVSAILIYPLNRKSVPVIGTLFLLSVPYSHVKNVNQMTAWCRILVVSSIKKEGE